MKKKQTNKHTHTHKKTKQEKKTKHKDMVINANVGPVWGKKRAESNTPYVVVIIQRRKQFLQSERTAGNETKNHRQLDASEANVTDQSRCEIQDRAANITEGCKHGKQLCSVCVCVCRGVRGSAC